MNGNHKSDEAQEASCPKKSASSAFDDGLRSAYAGIGIPMGWSLNPLQKVTCDLFVIKKRWQDQFWTCSSEHGCGWVDGEVKQSFTKSEMIREIRRMIERGDFCDVTVIRLIFK